MEDDPDFSRFDDSIHVARAAKDDVKYALLAHIEGHHCEPEGRKRCTI